jgi:RNA polymerase sigma factor (sigma-70 family)
MGATRGRGRLAEKRLRGAGRELDREQLESAERGFRQLLRRKRFSPGFLERHAGELLAKARLEYSQHVADGGEVRNPAGWIVHCAWRRTQNLLEQEGRAPTLVSIDNGRAAAKESKTPEEAALESDRCRRLQAAVERLPPEERKVIALTYFEGMSVREVGRALGWDKCKADRRHHAALKRLRKLLGVEDIDALGIEVGIAAWASVAVAHGARARIGHAVEAAVNSAGHSIAALAVRGQDLARRALTGGAAEPGVGPAVGGAARAAGVCGAAAIACVATGLVGPGVGGVDILAGQHHEQRRPARHAPSTPASAEASPAVPSLAPAPVSATETGTSGGASGKRGASKSKASKQHARSTPSASRATTSSQQAAEEFEPFRGGSESSSGEAATSAGSSPSQASGSSGESASPPPSPSHSSGKQVESEFGL